MRDLGQVLRHSVRKLRRSPGFAAVAIITLSLGIGANLMIFSVVNGTLLRPFAYPEPERLVAIGATLEGRAGGPYAISYPEYLDILEGTDVFDGVGVWDWEPYNLRADDRASFVGVGQVTPGVFQALATRPILGRTLNPEDDLPGSPEVVILSEGLWRSEFGGDPDIIGESAVLDGVQRTVIGVIPRGTEFPEETRLYVPLRMTAERSPRGMNWLGAVARLKSDVSLDQARAALATLASRLENQYPDLNDGRGFTAIPLREELIGPVRPFLLLLMGAVGFVLLIVCANVANLFLARASTQEREFAVRAALGASRGRILRHLLVESLVVAIGGCVVGFLLGQWGIDLILGAIPVEIPSWIDFALDWRVVAFMLALTVVTAMLFGLPPAVQVSRPQLVDSLKESAGRGTGGRRHQRLRSGLVVAEVALSLALLMGAGLMIRSFLRLSAIEPGFATADRAMATVNLAPAKYGEFEARVRFYRDVLEQLEARPGVLAAGAVGRFPLRGSSNSRDIVVEGQTADEAQTNPSALVNGVSPEYFRAMGIPLLSGRSFSSADRADASSVAIVNDAFVRRFWPEETPIGKRFRFGHSDADDPWIEVVGVVGGVRHFALEEPASLQLYVPYEQSASRRLSFMVHGSGDPAALMNSLRQVIASVDRDQAPYDVMTLEAVVDEAVWQWRFFSSLFAIFGLLAVLLAATGLYGVISYTAAQRTREIGIRMALGAARDDVVNLVVRQGLLLIGAGMALGLLVGLGLGKAMSAVLFEVRATDPITIIWVAAVLCAIGFIATYLPARRAARVDPVLSLRAE